MKITCFSILFLIFGNISFSQEINTEDNSKNKVLLSKELKLKPKMFKSYPNPIETYVYVIGEVRLTSIQFLIETGKVVLFLKVTKAINRLDVSELKKGIYLMKVTDENDNVEVKRIIKL